MGVREIDRILQQWEMDARGLHLRLILAPTPRDPSTGSGGALARPLASGPKAGRHRRRRKPWKETLTPSAGGSPHSEGVGQRL